MGHLLETIGRTLGFAAVACAIALSLPGIQAVRADDAAPPAASQAPDASYEGFASYMSAEGRPVEAKAAAPATCNAGAQNPLAVEMAHRTAVAQLQAQMMADARAAAAQQLDGAPEIVVLNGSGYNYRSPEPGVPSAAPPGAPSR